MPRESVYQRGLIRRLEELYPGCIVLRNDPKNLQGVPDILILFGNRWAMLEVKRSFSEVRQANQDYYIEKFDGMSFAAFICPENENEVLCDLSSAFRSRRPARVS